jgi:DNA-binding MurR/RpiR family transcriptional regulator
MLAYLIRKREEIESIPRSVKVIELSFRPSMKDLINMVHKRKQIKTILVTPSYMKTISKSMRMMLENQQIEMKETPSDMRGTRTDINGQYIEIPEGQ